MTTEREGKLYFEARNRALERTVENRGLLVEATRGFQLGLSTTQKYSEGGSQIGLELREVASTIKTETNHGFAFVCGVLAKLEAVKGKHYAASWQKRGEEVILANLQRKFDRLEIVLSRQEPEGAGENLTQTIGDLVVYGIKWLAFRAEVVPEEFAAWLEEVQSL